LWALRVATSTAIAPVSIWVSGLRVFLLLDREREIVEYPLRSRLLGGHPNPANGGHLKTGQ
jgi:hypothetical protein